MRMSRHPSLSISKARYDAVIFDLDGILTRTAGVHTEAWKELFDEYREASGGDWKPFDPEVDYPHYVDGKPRYDGVLSFLESRGVELPAGRPAEPPGMKTICGLGNRKNEIFHRKLEQGGVEVYEPGVELAKELRRRGFKTAVVSSSKNCTKVLNAAGIKDLFDTQADGTDLEKLGIKGKPAPDIFLEAARRIGADFRRAVVFEDAVSGVQAARAGRFGLVVGVDRGRNAEALRKGGADVVIRELSQVEVVEPARGKLPSALRSVGKIVKRAGKRRLAVFLDYDGTLTPIVDDAQKALMSDSMRDAVGRLADRVTVAVISGRDLKDVRAKVGIEEIVYAGSHGFDIAGPRKGRMALQQGKDYLPALDRAERLLKIGLKNIYGAVVERKRFSIAVHYRGIRRGSFGAVKLLVDTVAHDVPELRKSRGKKIFELRPRMDWHKGKALLWILEALDLDQSSVLPLYIGDDVTDEDAFRALKNRGIGIAVAEAPRNTDAGYILKNPAEVEAFLEELESRMDDGARP
jgi:trehalose-phosphatase